jgi:hypothetical protein
MNTELIRINKYIQKNLFGKNTLSHRRRSISGKEEGDGILETQKFGERDKGSKTMLRKSRNHLLNYVIQN